MNLQDHKANATLNIKMRYPEGVMTRREWINLKMDQGATVEESTKNRIEHNRIKFNRMSSRREQDEYEKKCDEKVVCYNLHESGKTSWMEITKTEYDYFQTLKTS